MGVDEGDPAPDFTLRNDENKAVTLSEELGQGPVVLSFYLFDFTRVCTIQACDFRDSLEVLQGHGAKVFGISVDSPFSHRAWKAEHRINFPLLSDWGHDVSKAYGVYYDEIFGLPGASKRSVFVIDQDGIVRYKWVTEDPGVPPRTEEVARVVQELAA